MTELFEKIAFPYLTTRLLPPPARQDLIARSRLYEKLARGLSYPLMLVVAPPGFGKTTLASAWLRTLSVPAAWVTLDPADNDPARFWGYFTAAIKKAYPTVLNPITSPYQLSMDGTAMAPEANLASLINSLAAISGEGIIVLDDFHLIYDPLIVNALAFLIEHLPANLHLLLVSRSVPLLPIHRLRARRQVLELHASDLRFSAAEAAEFLNRVMGLTLSQAAVQQLEARTEGWIAGLQLAALSLLERENRPEALQEITGDNRYIQDYLVEEVFLNLTADIQDFLLQTSILERLCGPLCDSLTGRLGSQAVLETLEQANLFITPLDVSRRWYRYHPLLGDMLRSRLAAEEPQRLAALHSRAARWYEANDDPSQAVTHYLAAGEIGPVGALILNQAVTLLNQNGMGTLLSWFKAMPDESLRSSPELSILYGWTLLYNARFNEVESFLQSAETRLASGWGSPAEIETWSGHIDAIRGTAAMNLGDEDRGLQLSQRALQHLPENEGLWRSILALNLGDGYNRRNETTRALAAYQQAVSAARLSGNISSLLIIYGSQGALLAGMGELNQAGSVYRQALQTAAESPDASSKTFPTLGKINAYYSSLLYEWNRVDEAAEQARQGLERCTQWGHLEHLIDNSLAYALATRALSAGEQGMKVLERAETIVSDTHELLSQSGQLEGNRKIHWLADRILKMRLHLLSLSGDFRPLSDWIHEKGLSDRKRVTFDSPILHDQAGCLLLARWLAQEGRADEAVQILEMRLRLVENSRRPGYELSVLVMLAAALHRNREPAQAVLTMERAVQLGQPQGYMRTIIDGGEPVRGLLEICSTQNESERSQSKKLYLDQLLTSFPLAGGEGLGSSSPKRPGYEPVEGLIEPLSQREVRVLSLVSAGLSNQAIADTLVVSVNTVKTHLKRIYAKLSVSCRVEAVEKAHRLNLF